MPQQDPQELEVSVEGVFGMNLHPFDGEAGILGGKVRGLDIPPRSRLLLGLQDRLLQTLGAAVLADAGGAGLLDHGWGAVTQQPQRGVKRFISGPVFTIHVRRRHAGLIR